jgi:hypothetical protein
MGLELVPTGVINTSELLEKLNAPKLTSSPSSPTLPPSPPSPPSPAPPAPPRAKSIHECAIAISKDGNLCAIGKYNLLLLSKAGGNWKISKLVEDEGQAQPGYDCQISCKKKEKTKRKRKKKRREKKKRINFNAIIHLLMEVMR